VKDILQKSAESYEPRGRLDPVGFERHVSFHTYLPPADLAPFIEHFWTIRWHKAGSTYNSDEVMHRPFVDVFVSMQQSGIQGTFRGKRTYIAAGAGRIIGARFRPGAFHAFWDGQLADLQDKYIDIQRVFFEADGDYIEQLLSLDDQAVIDTLANMIRAKNPQPDPNIELINEIITATNNDISLETVKAVAQRFHRSERWMQQLFQEYVGVGLKWLLQRNKLLEAAKRIRESENPDWAAIAYDVGYSSQQHFIADFKHVLGKTPLQYKKRSYKVAEEFDGMVSTQPLGTTCGAGSISR
jgi:AraC-like DNA-binding protein